MNEMPVPLPGSRPDIDQGHECRRMYSKREVTDQAWEFEPGSQNLIQIVGFEV
jgi:hypothetical protein